MDSGKRVLVGVFVVFGALLFAVGLFWIGDRRQLFSDSIELEANFMNVSGLSRGSVVRVAGADSGEVLDVNVPNGAGNPFRIRFRVTENMRPILREDSVATIQTDGLVGNKFLQIAAGTADAALAAPGSTIISREPIEMADVMDRIHELAESGNEAVDDIRSGINRTVDAMLELNREATEVIDEIGEDVQGITNAGEAIALNLGGIIEDVRAGDGTIGRILTDESLYDDMRAAAEQVQDTVANMRAMTDDFRAVTADFRELDLSQRIDTVGANIEDLTREAAEFTERASELIATFEGTAGPDGLMADVRRTLDNTNRAMENMADNTEALKRNWFFRGFFDDRGFYSIDAVSLEEYQDGRFLPDRQRIARPMDAAGFFEPGGAAVLSGQGRERIDTVMAEFMSYSKEDPLMVEVYTAGDAPQDLLVTRDRAVAIREYVVARFEMIPSYVGIMPMSVGDLPPGEQSGEGVALVLFASRGR
jgi:phospholipid/cholesterol/gamma-HCH transport system substrate-binding protein